MPSCSYKLSILRDNEFFNKLKRFCVEGVFQCFFVSRPYANLWCSNEVVIELIFWLYTNKNIIPEYCFVNFYKSFNKLCVLFINSVYKCKTYDIKVKLLKVFTLCVLSGHYVILIIKLQFYTFFYLSLVSQFKILEKFVCESFNKTIGFNCIDLRFKSNTVMEVDESLTEVSSCVNNLPNGDNLHKCNGNKLEEGKKSLCMTVIKENQLISKPSELLTINNGKTHENAGDVIIKEEINSYNHESLSNRNGIFNFNNDVESKIPVDLKELSENVNNLMVPSDNDTPSNINQYGSVKYEPEENLIKQNIEILKEENKDIISHDQLSEKSKNVNKNQCLDSTSNLVSSPSFKKHNSHQSSSSFSSSSRHKHKESRDGKHRSSSSLPNRTSEGLSTNSRKENEKIKSESRSKSRSCHHKPEEKCHCKPRHHSHHHSKSKKYQSAKTQCSPDEITFSLKNGKIDPTNPYFTRIPWVPHPQLANLKYGRFYRIEADRNGGATVCHLYFDEISHLSEAQIKECAIEFIKLSYSEDENECAHHVMGIVHGAASYLPDLVDYMADHYPTLTVKTGSLASRDNHTTTMSQYRDEVYKTYSNGTFRYAPLDQLSICGVLGEEVGAYFPDFVARLEQSPFMKPVMPWSFLSVVQTDNPRESNDGPIFWVRPGEQMLPANEALKESSRPKKRRNNELDNLAYIGGSRFSEARESLFMDRTKAHADQVGVDYGLSNTAPTAAVGVLKAVNCGHPEHGNRATKDVVAFHAQDYNELLEILMLDLYEPPQTQCTKWIEVSKLNTLRREGIRYAHLQLHDNDVYYLPRKIIHQFQTISSVASVAWHIRYRDYFSVQGAPNLHTPTGINKGQVFYEKKNVAVYCPPMCENDLLLAVTNMESGLKTPKKSERLREYSPFKHSPRKLHKYQSPRSASKKEKLSESVPPQTNNIKSDSNKKPIEHEKKNSLSSSKKRERSKSSDEKQTPGTHYSKRDHEVESPRSSEKSDSSHNHRSSGSNTPKKERKSPDDRYNHRKEVKNLESVFSDKPKRDKSSKTKHDRSDESRHDRSSKQSRRSSSSTSKGRKHDKNDNEQEKNKENGLNGHVSHKSKTEGKNDKERSLKRNHDECLNHTPSKKIKDETLDTGAGVVCENKTNESNPKNNVMTLDSQKSYSVEGSKVLENVSEEENKRNIIKEADFRNEKERELTVVPVHDNVVFQEDSVHGCVNNDLEAKVSNKAFVTEVSPFPPSPPLPVDFRLPSDDFSGKYANNISHPNLDSPKKDTLTNNILNDSVPSKEKSDNHFKKVKKKIAKKESSSYDLLGEIMSKMEKKKL